MFEKFLLNKDLMNLLLWLYNHRGEFSADIIQDEVGLDSFNLVKYLHLLYTLGVCEVEPEADTETLLVTTLDDTPLFDILSQLQNFIDEKMTETEEIEIVLGNKLDDFKDLVNDDSSLKIDELLDACRNDVEDESIDITRDDIIKFLVIFNNVFGYEA